MTESIRPTSSYDIHFHTAWSIDGFASVETCFKRARELGVRVLAIADHHAWDSRDQVSEIGANYPEVRVIPAAELTVTTSIGPVDLLCYGFPQESTEGTRKILDQYHAWQRSFGAAVSAGMQAIGIDYTEADRLRLLESYRPPEVIAVQGVTHVMWGVQRDAFIAAGYAEDGPGVAALLERASQEVPIPRFPAVEEVVSTLKPEGIRISIAHPSGYFEGAKRQRMDALVEECALDGIECAHPSHSLDLSLVYRSYCEEKGLFSTAGTDCHTDEQVMENLTRHGGREEWLDEFLERLPEEGKDSN